MCAAFASAPVPLYEEGTQFWQDLAKECQRYVDCINATLIQNGIDADGLLRCAAGPESLHVIKAKLPATIVSVLLNFFSWGPVIGVTICRQQADGHPFLPQEFELPIARMSTTRLWPFMTRAEVFHHTRWQATLHSSSITVIRASRSRAE
jgi:hypothetical protein